MIIFDLDNTLFNTSLLKEDLREVFIKHGLTDEEFWSTLRESYNIDPETKGCYSIEKHFCVFKNFNEDKKNKIEQETKKIIYQRGRGYLYDDVVPALNKLKKQKEKLILISKGIDSFQKLKLDVINLRDFFNKIYITPGDKIDILKNVTNGQPIFDINDHAEESHLVTKNFPNISCILIRRNGQERPKINIPIASNLDEVFQYIRSFQSN